jgi:hypothetical protein
MGGFSGTAIWWSTKLDRNLSVAPAVRVVVPVARAAARAVEGAAGVARIQAPEAGSPGPFLTAAILNM